MGFVPLRGTMVALGVAAHQGIALPHTTVDPESATPAGSPTPVPALKVYRDCFTPNQSQVFQSAM